jgi:type III secretion protein V
MKIGLPDFRAFKQQVMEGNLNVVLTRYSDIMLAVLVIAIIGIMIIPLPTFLLDILLATNITIAVVLLMTSLYLPNALSLASFPTILLITTLFRLALNVSSTRLILLYAYAGEVIESFGNFVVGGDYIVGFVIFLILTLIQFLVIAKGAERVSEVAARFTLDALPGKQMSIDADLRAGLIDAEEARKRRDYLGRESQFYGAMDGAMKFVKGDAIAGIIISVINIAAGLAIGVAVRGMSFADAAKTYTLLTIGDGLVSQIPALIIATAAGIITTRVAASSEDEEGSLGREIGKSDARPAQGDGDRRRHVRWAWRDPGPADDSVLRPRRSCVRALVVAWPHQGEEGQGGAQGQGDGERRPLGATAQEAKRRSRSGCRSRCR